MGRPHQMGLPRLLVAIVGSLWISGTRTTTTTLAWSTLPVVVVPPRLEHRMRWTTRQQLVPRRTISRSGHPYPFHKLWTLASEHDESTDPSSSSSSSGEPEVTEDSTHEGSTLVNEPLTPGSSLATGVFGVTKAMFGTGLLAMPGGLAAVSDHPSMLWPANILMATMAAVSGYTFSLYGRLAFRTKSKSLESMWSTIFRKENAEDGSKTSGNSLPISLANFIYCYGAALTFLLVIADAMTSLSQLACPTGVPWWASRPSLVLSVVVGCLWPLCSLRSLQALAPVSLIGVLGCLVTTAFVVFRCPAVFPSSPYAAAGQFSTYNRVRGPAPLVLFSMGCIALMAHFSAPAFLTSLQPKRPDGSPVQFDTQSLRRYNLMTIISYVVVAVVDAICLTFGFLTFGGKSAGIVLNNYSPTDWGAALSRFLTALSVGGSFPLVFDAARSSVAGLLGIPSRQRKLTGLLLASITAMALVVKNAGFVVSFNGILMGTAILYIFPSLMFLRLTQSQGRNGERLFCRFLVGFGVVSALIGAATTVMNTYFPHLLL